MQKLALSTHRVPYNTAYGWNRPHVTAQCSLYDESECGCIYLGGIIQCRCTQVHIICVFTCIQIGRVPLSLSVNKGRIISLTSFLNSAHKITECMETVYIDTHVVQQFKTLLFGLKIHSFLFDCFIHIQTCMSFYIKCVFVYTLSFIHS